MQLNGRVRARQGLGTHPLNQTETIYPETFQFGENDGSASLGTSQPMHDSVAQTVYWYAAVRISTFPRVLRSFRKHSGLQGQVKQNNLD